MKKIKKKIMELRYRNIVRSEVSWPDLIAKNANITDSRLDGKIRVGEKTIIQGASINGETEIGRNTTLFGPGIAIYTALNTVTIGNFCSIARNVLIQEYGHMTDRLTTYFILHHVFGDDWKKEITSKGSISIGNDVWVGANAVILTGVTIGDGAVIGANSVVTKDIPPYAVAAGSPAKLVKHRFDKPVIERLLELKWWLWPQERILKNRGLFEGKLDMEMLKRII